MKSARILGLGDRAVVEVPADDRVRLRPDHVSAVMRSLRASSLTAIALVATAGTTDLGAIDPLEPLSGIAREQARGLQPHRGRLRLELAQPPSLNTVLFRDAPPGAAA